MKLFCMVMDSPLCCAAGGRHSRHAHFINTFGSSFTCRARASARAGRGLKAPPYIDPMSYGLELDDERVQLAFLDGSRKPALLHGDVIQTARSEAGPEVSKARRDRPARRGARRRVASDRGRESRCLGPSHSSDRGGCLSGDRLKRPARSPAAAAGRLGVGRQVTGVRNPDGAPPTKGVRASSIAARRFRPVRGRHRLQRLIHLGQRSGQRDGGIEM